jgi:hypothetical protein
MEILPLTYDKYFKKAFSNKDIARRFLEDFFDVEIEEIVLLQRDENLTNEARELRFDCRCKSESEHFIVEMQQWYKYDAIKRFYMYHCANTVLQLKDMPKANRMVRNRRTGEYRQISVKDYSTLTPVNTILWFVDDSLKMNKGIVKLALSVDTDELLLNDELWELGESGLRKLLDERNELLSVIKN